MAQAAHAAEPPSEKIICTDDQGQTYPPNVANPNIATEIFRIFVRREASSVARKFAPDVKVIDEGKSWQLLQAFPPRPKPKLKAGEVVVSFLPMGNLSMKINKCTGAISEKHLNRD